MQLTKTISESVEKVRASVDRPQGGPQEKEDRVCLMLVRLAETGPGEPVRFECGSPSFVACP
jgi:hypothetical protein